MSVKKNGVITSLDLLATGCLIQPRKPLASSHCQGSLLAYVQPTAHQNPQIIFSSIPVSQTLLSESPACTNAGFGPAQLQDFAFSIC